MNPLRTRRDIEIDFVKACNQSKELMDISQSLVKIARSDMAETMAMMRSGWKGENAQSFYEKTEELRGELMNNHKRSLRYPEHIPKKGDGTCIFIANEL